MLAGILNQVCKNNSTLTDSEAKLICKKKSYLCKSDVLFASNDFFKLSEIRQGRYTFVSKFTNADCKIGAQKFCITQNINARLKNMKVVTRLLFVFKLVS